MYAVSWLKMILNILSLTIEALKVRAITAKKT